MKELLLLFLFAFASTVLNAQDIIVKQNGDELQSKVIEINDTEVKYKAFDNLDGPLYVIKKIDIFMIKYQNGTKEIFTNRSTDNQTAVFRTDEIPNNTNYSYLTYKKFDEVYMNGRRLTIEEIEELFEKNEPIALNLFKTGLGKRKTGITLLSIGVPLFILSIPVGYFSSSTGLIAIMDITGTALIITSICFTTSGKARIKNSYKEYNNSISRRRNNVSLNFGVVNNGIGVSLRF